eukprot:TRINITY_DN2114_c0_g1_i1.p1 TRINITY_DN2114_c0_g1~~TRINITY_DN2114_c0_g1_i1.p1  ORF type:complete len:1118 (+),score=270.95 TRINITY_DN2114_c0_g1_i1:165-3518(+)
MTDECGVAVGVRIRPFNQREKDLGAKLCVSVEGATTTLLPPPPEKDEPKKEEKKFTFDASFWSHDGFEETESGYLRPAPGSNYADQQLVFETFGKSVLDNAWAGYHCCLFAYGQTGAGKSYSMVGYGGNRGIVPISCEEIFRRISANTDTSLKYEVLVSMTEIYNEQVQDLFLSPKARPKKGLEIRESKQLGIYIEGVTKRPVSTYQQIEAAVEEGTENRTVGSTLMNATSSRAHTVLIIEFKQISEASGQTGTKVSLINLVDLAGSEKAGQTGASGDRLKEGCAINKSLSALGNVIEKLADKATAKAGKTVLIPYRDSKLTRLLQNALGGSSKTVMICAISPASSNYEETLSTLRYADRAKRIKNTAVVNENPADKLIRQLREENAKLKEMVGKQQPVSSQEGPSAEVIEEMEMKKAEIATLENALEEISRSFKDRLAEAEARAAQRGQDEKPKADLSLPHIANLNEDQLLTNKLRFAFTPEGRTHIGRSRDGSGDEPQIVLAGPGIQQDHAYVDCAQGKCTIFASDQALATTYVNGQNPKQGQGLAMSHSDRVVFGQCIFIFIDPSIGKFQDLVSAGTLNYAAARKEVSDGGSEEQLEELKASRERAEELEQRVRDAEAAKAQARAEAEAQLKEREEEFRVQMEALKRQQDEKAKSDALAEASMAAEEQTRKHAVDLERIQREFEERQRRAEEASQSQIRDLERKAKKAAAEEEDHRQREQNMRRLEEQLMVAMPLVKEANLIAAELRKPHTLETKMAVEMTGDTARGSVHITAVVLQEGVRVYEWPLDTLENRVFLMRELLERCEEEGIEACENLSCEEDPFWDPIEVVRLIGVAQASLKGLLMQVENTLDCRILTTEVLGVVAPRQVGSLRVEIWPCGKDGTPGVPDEEVVDEPEDLVGSSMQILLQIVRAKGLPEELANDVRIEYKFFIDDAPHVVPTVPGHSTEPQFDYKQTFEQDPVTSRFMEYCERKALVFKVYGADAAALRLKETLAQQELQRAQNAAAQAEAAAEAEAAAGQALAEAAVYRHIEPEMPPAEVPGCIPEPHGYEEEASWADPAAQEMIAQQEAYATVGPEPEPSSVPSLAQIRRDQERAVEASGGAGGDPKSKACAIL